MSPMRGHLQKPCASDSQFLVLPRDLVHAWLLDHVPEAQSFLLMTAPAVHQSEQKKSRDVYLLRHVIYLKCTLLFLNCRLLPLELDRLTTPFF